MKRNIILILLMFLLVLTSCSKSTTRVIQIPTTTDTQILKLHQTNEFIASQVDTSRKWRGFQYETL